MKRNGLVLVPREPPKRVILYPTQDLTSQQQPTNGVSARVKTALVNNNQHYQRETVQQSTNELRLSRQQTASSLPNGISKLAGKSEHERVVSQPAGQPTSQNAGQRGQNPYYGNPFFRPKPATNQLSTTTPVFNGNLPQTPPSRDSSTVVTGLSTQTHTSVSTTATVVNRGRPPVVLKTTNPNVPSNGRMQEPEITTDALPSQEDNRRWAHTVASAPAVRRVVNGEGPNIPFKSSETNISSHANNDAFKQKATSATDIVISLMDTWRAPINPGSSSITNMFTRNGITRDDSTVASQTLPAGEQVTSAPPFITVGTSAAGSHSNQNWKKALVANFQKNSRNNPTAKLFTSKQTNVPIQPPTVVNNDTTTANQQSKPERTMMLNGLNSERTFQLSENPPSIPSLIRKTTESFRLTKQDNNTNNIERSASLQIQSTMYSNTASIVVENKPEKSVQPIEVPIPENIPLIPIPIPSTLITAKPQANVEQQRAIITRVMIRRDFVKSTESKPAIPAVAMNFRSSIAPQSAKPGGLPTDNATAVTTIIEHVNVVNSNVNGNRIYPFQPPQSQQQSVPLSQKSLLAYTSTNPTTRESYKTELNAHQTNGFTNDVLTSSSMMKIQQSQIMTTNGPNIRSNSLSATNAESKRKKDELTNKLKKRAISASAASNDGMSDKDPFEMEDEEYEGELEEDSVRSSESDVDTENAFSLDPAILLSDKVRRVNNTEVKSGFIPSLFNNVPPTIRFCTENQRLEQLPLPLRKMMKWKMSTITPNIVKNTVIRSGFRLIGVDEGSDWLGTWSRHMKPICFKAVREYQKVNHFPGSFQIGRKDRLWRNLSHMQAVHSRREFDFVPQTFVLPADFLLFKRVFDELTDTKESKWIIKPPASARGQGIRVISKMEHVPKKRPVIVQKYIANPYLINGHKFDLRLYVYVTSHDPLRIYLFDDGLTRFASRKYSSSVKSLSDRFMHLTNYSINRYNSEYRTNNDSAACTGHKWSLKALWTYLRKRDVDVAEIMEKIKDLIIKTIISADSYINVLTKANIRRKFCVHELFGFDVILDEQCKPYIVEVNISPSLHSNSPLDINVKGAMISDLLNLSGFMIPDRRDILYEGSTRRKAKLPKSLIFDRRVLPQNLSIDEKVKHQYFAQRYHDEQARRNILDVLTPDDLRILIETEDEFSRRGSFERIFPTNQTRKYLKYFETPRYYNILLNEWITKYHRLEERGIALLNAYCKKSIHLQHPAVDPNHMWTQYQKLQGHSSYRENDNTNGS